MSSIPLWSVYHVKDCKQSNPKKDKFVIIICRYPDLMGFFINTEIRPYILNNQKLLKLQVEIDFENHPKIKKNRWIDCSDLKKGFLESELNDYKYKVSDEVRNKIEKAISVSDNIEGRDKKSILGSSPQITLD